jgi:hypothetical protein
MAKALYISTTVGSTTHVHRIGPPGKFPIARIVPFGSSLNAPAPAPRTSSPRKRTKKKGRRTKG